MSASGGRPGYTYTRSIDSRQVYSTTTTAASTSYAWDTTAAPAGSRGLALTTTDAAGTAATATRTVIVQNVGSLTLTLTTPQPGETVSGVYWVNIWIQAPYGTAPSSFAMSAAGATAWTQSSSSTHVILPWDTTKTPDGSQTLSVSVRDAAGATSTTIVSVVVQNP